MKKIAKAWRTFMRWKERGDLHAEQQQIRYWGDYAQRRTPRILKRLVQLDHEEAVDNGLPLRRASDFEVDGLAGQWKGPA